MSEPSLAQPARASTPTPPRDLIAERVEEELARLREARPHLIGRIDRAATIVVVHLSSASRNRPIRCRVRRGGHRVMLVSSLSSGGVTYEVDTTSWSCSCPDARRRGGACKHSLAGWVLYRASLAVEDYEEGGQDPDPQEGLTHAQVARWLGSQEWIFAKTMKDNPHEYCLRRNAGDEAMFEAVVEHVREFGQPYPWWGTIYLQYVAGSHAYWTMGARVADTALINRKSLERVRLDQLTNKGGGGIVWPWLHKDVEAERAELRRREAGQHELGEGP